MSLFYPRRDVTPPPFGAQDLLLEVAPAVRLHARVHFAARASVNLVLFYGNGELAADYDDQAPSFARAGARLTVIDYRGYGRSDGVPSLAALRADVRPALERLLAHFAGEAPSGPPLPVIVMGRSLGSLCAAELAGVSPALAQAIVIESGFGDLVALAARLGLLQDLSAADREASSPLQKLASSPLPLLVLHGAEDDMITPDEGRALHAASGARYKRLAIVPGRGHDDLSLAPDYWRALSEFAAWVAADGTEMMDVTAPTSDA